MSFSAGPISANPGMIPVAKEIIQFPLWANDFLTPIEVASDEDFWLEYSLDRMEDLAGTTGDYGAVVEIYEKAQKNFYLTLPRAYQGTVPYRKQIAAQARGQDEIQRMVSVLATLCRNRKEILAAKILQNDASYQASNLFTGVAGVPGAQQFTKWALPSTGTPIADFEEAFSRLGAFDNATAKLTVGLGKKAYKILSHHQTLLDAIQGVKVGGQAGLDDIKQILSKTYPVEKVVLLQSFTVNPSTKAKISIWDEEDVVISVTHRGQSNPMIPTFGAIVTQKIALENGTSMPEDQSCAVFTDTNAWVGALGGTRVKVASCDDFVIIDKDYGVRLKNAVA